MEGPNGPAPPIAGPFGPIIPPYASNQSRHEQRLSESTESIQSSQSAVTDLAGRRALFRVESVERDDVSALSSPASLPLTLYRLTDGHRTAQKRAGPGPKKAWPGLAWPLWS
jgi:hypothetical protein